MKFVALGAVLAALVPASAGAIVLEIDSFNQGTVSISDGVADGVAAVTGPTTYTTADGYDVTRTISINVNSKTTGNPTTEANVSIFDGEFFLSNDSGVDSTAVLSYDIGNLTDALVAAGGSQGFLQVSVLEADLQRTLELFVNGELQSGYTATDQVVADGEPDVRLLPFDIGSLTGTDMLELRINGVANLDYRLTLLAIGNEDVPEPAMIGLLGLGLAGLGFARARKAR